MKKAFLFLSVMLCLVLLPTGASAAWKWVYATKSWGQTILIPASHVDFSYTKDSVLIDQRVNTVITVRNADPLRTITLKSVKFYDPEGVFAENMVSSTQAIAPLASLRLSTSALQTSLYAATGKRPTIVLEWEASVKAIPPNIYAADSTVRPDGDGFEILALASLNAQVIRERLQVFGP